MVMLKSPRHEPFHYRGFSHPRWKYKLESSYTHTCAFPLRLVRHPASIDFIHQHVEEHCTLTLLRGYAWNGSNVVADVNECMRASAIHDAHCQGMEEGIYVPSLRNWIEAAAEYRHNCIADGMPRWRAWARYTGVVVGGGNQVKWRALLRRS